MKALIAIEILKRLQNSDYFDRSKLKLSKEYTLENAIVELEALQQPKSCDGCKYFKQHKKFNFQGHCEKGVTNNKYGEDNEVDNTFCCNRYEPKEQ